MRKSENKSQASVSGSRRAMIEAANSREWTSSGRDKVDVQCQKWLATNGSIQALLLRWSRLEARLVVEQGWFEMTKDEQQATPEASELRAIDVRVDELQRRQGVLLKALLKSRARSIRGAATKVAVAASLIAYEDNPEAHALIESSLRDFAALGICSNGQLGGERDAK